MIMRLRSFTLLVATSSVLAACDSSSTVDPPEIMATGTISGRVVNDTDGFMGPSNGDPPIPGAVVRAAFRGTTTPIAADTTDMTGNYAMEVPVGAYWVTVDSTLLADSLQTVFPDTVTIEVPPGSNRRWDLAVGIRRETVESVRNLPPGQVVSVFGFALNDRTVFGDSVLHIREGDWSIRATTVFRAPIRQGDSVRVSGTTAIDNGQPVIDRVTATALAFTGTPIPPLISTGVANTAQQGMLDASHARVRNVAVVDTVTINGQYRATVDDGSGPLVVEVDSDVQFNNGVLRPGVPIIEIAGVLVPVGDGTWVLKPRGQSDVQS